MKYLILAILLVGCQDGTFGLTEEARARIQTRGNMRLQLFKECMQLAAQITRVGDDDVSDIVDSCSSQSLYITNYKGLE